MPGPIPLRAFEVDSDGRRVQIQGVRADDDVARVGEHPLASRSTPLLTFSPPSFQHLPRAPLLNSSPAALEGLFHEESGGGVSAAASGSNVLNAVGEKDRSEHDSGTYSMSNVYIWQRLRAFGEIIPR
jgi:hypothetical protein